ncbi:3-oxoadipyl-CoA thiolase [Bacillus fonticola]|uniref:3-oxoadipyl-CoA thiolase n=1 Tax=Bacillus fonticola TaxID=2728853 RepID=UPI0014759EBB|nr:3-oxoadipyl-CoA thiolase [Bacillus fonticola]
MREVVIVDAVRSPIGRYGGALRSIRPDDLAAQVLQQLLKRNPNLPQQQIEQVILGCANQAGEDNRNVARMATLLAGLPVTVAATTINRLCGSGMDAVQYAARTILAGEEEVIIAGGVESMTRAPFVMAKSEHAFARGNQALYDTTIGWRFTNPTLESKYGAHSMPETAENVAMEYGISRAEQDEFAYESQQRTSLAMKEGRFNEEIVPISVPQRKGETVKVTVDEHPRPETTVEKLQKLRPLFDGGTVTAGNASGVNDGASVLLLMSREKAEAYGLQPLVTYRMGAAAGVEPRIMGIGPIEATKKCCERAGVSLQDVERIELNEAFASQSIACIRSLGLDSSRVNVNGGAIALGHPLGASGARILTTLLYEMKRSHSRYGLATMCIGVGQGIATLVEREEQGRE